MVNAYARSGNVSSVQTIIREGDGRMIAMVTAGFTGVGKTTFVEEQINLSGLTPFIFDVNGEYPYDNKICFHGSVKDYLTQAKTKKDTFFVLEEATLFFKQQGISQDAMYLLTQKRHMSKIPAREGGTGSIVMFNFHSLRKVPLDILDLINYLVIFKTNDRPVKIEEKFGLEDWGVYDAYMEVRESPNAHEKRIIEIIPPPVIG